MVSITVKSSVKIGSVRKSKKGYWRGDIINTEQSALTKPAPGGLLEVAAVRWALKVQASWKIYGFAALEREVSKSFVTSYSFNGTLQKWMITENVHQVCAER